MGGLLVAAGLPLALWGLFVALYRGDAGGNGQGDPTVNQHDAREQVGPRVGEVYCYERAHRVADQRHRATALGDQRLGQRDQVGDVVGDEARGYNVINPRVWGVQLWAPVVNLLRDPRWGRNEEGYSEDARLTGAIATAYGQGLEGDVGLVAALEVGQGLDRQGDRPARGPGGGLRVLDGEGPVPMSRP